MYDDDHSRWWYEEIPDWDEDALPENPDDRETILSWWRRDIRVTATTPDGEPVL